MIRAGRIIQLAARTNLHSKLKFVLLSALLTIGVLVFLSVSELSRASTDDLSEAIESDLGEAGTYRFDFSPDLGLSGPAVLGVAQTALTPFTSRPLRAALRLSSVHPECPPYDQIGEVSPAVLLDASGRPTEFDPTVGDAQVAGLTRDDLCLAGLVVPRNAVRAATRVESQNFGAALIIDPAYERAVELTSTTPATLVAVMTTGRTPDQSDEIRAALTAALAGPAALASIHPDSAVVVTRGDTGASVRSASEGIRLVYGLIGWGVLLVSGLGVLIAELIVLRDRTWYFGLVRAVGARRSDVAALVVADIVLVLVAGFGMAALIAELASPLISSFGQTAFQTQLTILRAAAVPKLIVGAIVVLVLGGAYPAWRATRLDPLDVLERR